MSMNDYINIKFADMIYNVGESYFNSNKKFEQSKPSVEELIDASNNFLFKQYCRYGYLDEIIKFIDIHNELLIKKYDSIYNITHSFKEACDIGELEVVKYLLNVYEKYILEDIYCNNIYPHYLFNNNDICAYLLFDYKLKLDDNMEEFINEREYLKEFIDNEKRRRELLKNILIKPPKPFKI